MKFTTSNAGRRLMNELRVLRDYPFEQRCGAVLQTVFPAMVETPARGDMDRAGIDHCMFGEGQNEIVLAFQCKGFSVQEPESAQVNQCLHSIETFSSSPFKATQYGIIVNRIVKGESRAKIEAALQSLVAAGKAERALLLGLETFLEMIFQEAQKQTTKLLRSSVAEFQRQHRLRMDEGMYVENVPFIVEGVDALHNNPSRFVEREILSLVEHPHNKRSWTFVSGEFGFGKTSLCLHLAGILQEHGVACLYLPVAQFHPEAFEREESFIWEALQIILQEEVDRTDERNRILHAALKEVLKREKKIALIFDGIDEHPICWRENGLMCIFGIFKKFNTTCLFSLRAEFLAERRGHFEAAIKGSPPSFILRLIEWPEPLITDYTNHYMQGTETAEAKVRVSHFEQAVRSGAYVGYYGDIPKRPLFLKMLLDDVAKEDLRNRNLAQLYDIYIRKKFERDRATSTSSPVVLRPLSLDEDYEIVCARLFELMTMAAGRMYAVEDGEIRLEPRLSEATLRKLAEQIAGGSLDLATILLNSVLVPVGRRNREHEGGYIQVSFAHLSFQEFFFARYILDVLRGKIADSSVVCDAKPKAVMRFLAGMISLLPEEERLNMNSRYPDFTGYINRM